MSPCVYTTDEVSFRFAPEFPADIALLPQAEREAAGWYNLIAVEPAHDESHYAAPVGYERVTDGYARVYEIRDKEFIPRRFSKLSIYGAIISLPDTNGVTAWDRVKSWLESKAIDGVNGWMAFQLAQEISDGHPLFAALSEEARVLLGLTNEQFESMLNACILTD